MNQEPEKIYHIQMSEIKLRILSAERVIGAASPVTGLMSLDCEYCFLQIRKIIELITFGGMIREEKRYRKFRMNESIKDDPTSDWKAKKILEKLIQLSSHMMPIPLGKFSKADNGVINFDRVEGDFNHKKLISLYEVCSEFMHSTNPLLENYNLQIEVMRRKYIEAGPIIKEALLFLRQLLWVHAAVQLEWTETQTPNSIENPQHVWILDFNSERDDVVGIMLATAQE